MRSSRLGSRRFRRGGWRVVPQGVLPTDPPPPVDPPPAPPPGPTPPPPPPPPAPETGYFFPREVVAASRSSEPLRLVQTDDTIFWIWGASTRSADRLVMVRFRPVGSNNWMGAHTFPLDTRTFTQTNHKLPPEWVGKYRSMITWLSSLTSYEVQVMVPDTGEWQSSIVRTWPSENQVPRSTDPAKIITLTANRTTALTIEASFAGTHNAYSTINLNGRTISVTTAYAIRLAAGARYVVVENGTITGATGSLVEWLTTPDDVTEENEGRPVTVFRKCRFHTWGSPSAIKPQFGANYQSCIRTANNRLAPQGRLMVVDCLGYNPRHRSNFWIEEGDQRNSANTGYNKHPSGPQFITLEHVSDQGRVVIKRDRTYCDNGRAFNDCVGGSNNATMRGFPGTFFVIANCDFDNAADDPIEGDGAGFGLYRECRVQNGYTAASQAPIIVGPSVWLCCVFAGSRTYDPNAINVNNDEAYSMEVGLKTRTDQTWGDNGYLNTKPSGQCGGGRSAYLFCSWPKLPTHTTKSSKSQKGHRICITSAAIGFGEGLEIYGSLLLGIDRTIQYANNPKNKISQNVLRASQAPEIPSDQLGDNVRSGTVAFVSTAAATGVFRLADGSIGRNMVEPLLNLCPPVAPVGGLFDTGAFQQNWSPTFGPVGLQAE